ncbi:hypothetical protein AC1031_007827 [Aphanomyces cochlioides]|nr:hypothetical protein AC1031_007827 [Aphanomyces cochlioides]
MPNGSTETTPWMKMSDWFTLATTTSVVPSELRWIDSWFCPQSRLTHANVSDLLGAIGRLTEWKLVVARKEDEDDPPSRRVLRAFDASGDEIWRRRVVALLLLLSLECYE